MPIEIAVAEREVDAVEADVLAFAVVDPARLLEAGERLDAALRGRLSHLIDDGELKGEPGHVTLVHTAGELAAHRVAAAGIGREQDVEADRLRTAAARVAGRASWLGGGTIAWAIANGLGLDPKTQAESIVHGTILGSYDAGLWKTKDRGRKPVERLVLCGAGAGGLLDASRAAAVASEWANRCRDLVNTPASELTPERLADRAGEIAAEHPHLQAEALGPGEISEAGMGAFSAVAQGSETPPRLIVLAYEPPDARQDLLLGLVGKAITFDSGGLSLKPSLHMEEMKGDMAGGAAVLCGVGAVAGLGLSVRILAIVPACENMPSGHAYRPGDIVTALNGKTIEVTNTDAEGRLVLADALVYARRRGATHLLDLATLTGAVVIALGDFYAGLLGNDEPWLAEIRAAGEASGDHAWPLPLHETYRRYIRSTFADMKNSSDLRQAGPIYGARFLQEFAGDGPWAHLDIAGTAYLSRSRGDYFTGRGATGYGVRLIAELAQRLADAAPLRQGR